MTLPEPSPANPIDTAADRLRNRAKTAVSVASVSSQGEPAQVSVNASNSQSWSAIAVNRTSVAAGKSAEHDPRQSIPPGSLRIAPAPSTVIFSCRGAAFGGGATGGVPADDTAGSSMGWTRDLVPQAIIADIKTSANVRIPAPRAKVGTPS
jgi:hypothetical protein